MEFTSQNEEKLFKKWLKESPFNQSSQQTFQHTVPDEEKLLNLFRKDKEYVKQKQFVPFQEFYADTFAAFLPQTLTEEQEKILNTLKWRYIAQKIDAMNKVLKYAYELLDKGEPQKAVDSIRNLAEAGHPEACYLMACIMRDTEFSATCERRFPLFWKPNAMLRKTRQCIRCLPNTTKTDILSAEMLKKLPSMRISQREYRIFI